ncbi:MAG: hypothetical protein COW00_12535 [Bdellovibrio sp. CG12_big_fil_rev_8_21_14_0_65_39_13]|nr:MAG: hypothetical protein COW78_20245 [Bdellovibrio sp. CG22_combo_CG10-13_8_21_14_all_39_27]PIQ59096.1 MAG: hypothetical protein COW00_12535 [Bdellovibrio sp. CG12_big_fil_rev_8_21_14_0_65_39_13]PIR33607.1 MAG: hypothetical protein COV37_15760 [Bdellovibrio sp. CG11_big_fil_rev_8_21_14_0_20_39_38]PJB54332.1 MAG: hypothetical protein CO099_02160 [Bdellovibrio sp. CG_4_9_14_3_um_filter_39_7]
MKAIIISILFFMTLTVKGAESIDTKKCSQELNQHCSAHKGKKTLGKCIQEHFKDFSKGCGNYLLTQESSGKPGNPRCATELQKACQNSDKECYDKNRKRLSLGCQEEMDQIFSQTAFKMLDSCMGDIERNCPLDLNAADDPMAQNKYNECVLKNMKNFSPECLDSMGMDKGQFEEENTKTIKKEKR